MMNLQKNSNPILKIVIGLSPALIIVFISFLPSPAQTIPNKPQRTSPTVTKIQFPSSPDRGTPKRTGAGGRRGNSCLITKTGQPSLTALMPTWDNHERTAVKNPMLYVYVPKTTTKTGEFVVIDDEGNEVYQNNFIPPSEPGIVQISIPTSASLKTGKKYFWYFTLICNPEDRSQDEYTSGSLERTQLGSLLNSDLKQIAPLKRAEIYAKNKIWYETISNIASLRNENPEIWTDLLTSVGLEEFTTIPFVEFGTPKP
ncbi:DUF928 domain-containing protein [Anabaena sp. UHCC 0451]|uniref:DUF928 domain-containing protein n=1 Tax=Anabaena sp. UHCC 0451 TaxID=2055235 RepID=UPI002B208F0F|nr:DUF928 domain-containing protein [Anabaena sp. UHCC 0451]MEA5575195.1 DUF928 domain-containing protein [Anabaena sp. UHCC 0451]